MRHHTECHPTTEQPPIAERRNEPGSLEAGRQLDEAQSADHAWRTRLVLRLYLRLRYLRRFDLGVQLTGAGLGVLLLFAAMVELVRCAVAASEQSSAWLLTLLIAGAIVTSAGGLLLVAAIAWCQERIRSWIVRMGLEAQLASLERVPPGVATSDWTCGDCRTENLGEADVCAICARPRPADAVLVRLWSIRSRVVLVAERLGMVMAWLLAGIMLLAFLCFLLASLLSRSP